MKRTLGPLFITAAIVVGSSACKKDDANSDKAEPAKADAAGPDTKQPPAKPAVPSEPGSLIPDSALGLLHINLQSIGKTPMLKELITQLEADPNNKKKIEAAAACNAKIENMVSFTMGGAPDGNSAVILRGAGVGEPKVWQCIQDAGKKMGEDVNYEVKTQGGEVVLVFDQEQPAEGHFLAPDTMAIVTPGWSSAVKGLAKGEGKPIGQGEAKNALARVDRSKHIWFAAAFSGPDQPLQGAKDVSGTIDVSNGLAVAIKAATESADKAKELKMALDNYVTQAKSMIGPMQLPKDTLDTAKIEAQGADISASISLTPDQIKTIQAKLQPMLTAMMASAEQPSK